jgi:hypothetical protein
MAYNNEGNPIKELAIAVGISEPILRNALAHKPVTRRTAARLSKHLRIDEMCFVIKQDNRKYNSGLKKGEGYVKKESQAKAHGSSAEDKFRA